jgi:hypothetical protein
MIIIQTSRIFVIPESSNSVEISRVEPKNEPKKIQSTYSKKVVKYFIPEFYI